MRHFLASTILASAVSMAPATAATLNTLFKIDGQVVCAGVTADTNGVKTCNDTQDVNGNLVDVTMQSREADGNLGISGTITVTDNRPGATNGGMSTVGEVSINFSDTLTFDTSSGAHNFLLPFDLLGTLFAPEPSSDITGGGGISEALVNADLVANGIVTTLYTELHQGRTGIFDDEDFGGPSAGALGITEVLLPIVNGMIDLNVGLNGRVSCAARIEASGTCTASFDFLNSLRLLGGTVLDASGNEIAGASVTSTSGFDYLTGVAPHNIGTVPLPASFGFLLAGLAGLGLIGRRRRMAA